MTNEHKGTIAGVALGSFISMLLILFAIVTMPGLSAVIVPLAALGVFLGAFSGCLVTMTWATREGLTNRFMVLEVA